MNEERLQALLEPYIYGPVRLDAPPRLFAQLNAYLDLLLRWNARTNLTAVRDPDEIVRRHFGESLFAAAHLQAHIRAGSTLLDLGSGAGFPGLPVQLCFPQLAVTLAESQGKKAAFLREVVRTLGLKTQVWAGRAEAMPSERLFEIVTLRAVDQMEAARRNALSKLSPSGVLAELTVATGEDLLNESAQVFPLPGTEQRVLRMLRVGA